MPRTCTVRVRSFAPITAVEPTCQCRLAAVAGVTMTPSGSLGLTHCPERTTTCAQLSAR